MSDKGIQVGRPFPPLNDWCRISTGKMDDLQRFGEALKAVMS
jgi:histidinol-phosphate aminotransferase